MSLLALLIEAAFLEDWAVEHLLHPPNTVVVVVIRPLSRGGS